MQISCVIVKRPTLDDYGALIDVNLSRPDHREPLFLYGVVGQGVTRGILVYNISMLCSSLYFLCWCFV